MTALEPYTPQAPALAADIAVQRLGEWATSAQAASTVAAELVKTSFVPEAFRGKPYEATAAILAGLEVGLSPMAALRSFDIIQGQAAPRALTLRAIVQSHGHDMQLEESTATRCRMRGRRRGSNEWQTVVWTIDRARQLGVTGKHNWKAQPQAMLLARATSELARLIAADAILGIGYSSEEIADGASGDVLTVTMPDPNPETGEVAATPEPGTRKMRRKAPAAPAPEPPAEDIADADIVDTDHPSEPQTKMVMALFNERGITAREDRLDYISALLDRNVGSWKDCSRDEASKVIDALNASPPADAPALLGDDQ